MLDESLSLAWAYGAWWALAAPLFSLAILDTIEGNPERAARLVGAADSLIERYPFIIPPPLLGKIDRALALATAALGLARVAAARNVGRRLPLADAVGQAFGASPRSPVAESPSRSEHALTPRQVAVLRLMAEGHADRAIADALFISTRTASQHTSAILARLGITSRAAAVALALRHNLT